MISNFEEWWFEIGSGIYPKNGEDMETHAKRVAMAAIFGMNEQLFIQNKKITNRIVMKDQKTPDNYRAEGWYQFSNRIAAWLNL